MNGTFLVIGYFLGVQVRHKQLLEPPNPCKDSRTHKFTNKRSYSQEHDDPTIYRPLSHVGLGALIVSWRPEPTSGSPYHLRLCVDMEHVISKGVRLLGVDGLESL